MGERLLKDDAKLDEELYKFSKDLFQFWDAHDYGKLSIKTISDNFLALGLALRAEQVIQIFQPTILSTLRNEGALGKEYVTSQGLVDLKRLTMDKVGHVEVTVGEFCAVFKGNDYGPKMIRILKVEALELQRVADKERKQLEEHRRQRE